MATINEDSDSWRAGGIQKRDFNHAHEDPEVPKRAGKAKKKNTKKWCKGIEGREHDVRTVQIVEFNDNCLRNGSYQYVERDGKMVREQIRCGHWRHHAVKCVGCGKEYWQYSYQRNKDTLKLATQQELLAAKWCDKGHLWDWEEFDLHKHNQREPKYMGNVVVRNGDYMRRSYHWRYGDRWISARIRISQYCVMCGKQSGKTKRIYPGDTPWLS